MSIETVRTVYPILISLARELSEAARERRTARWVSYDDLCQRCKEVGVKETPRTIATKLLKPLQAACLEKSLPDLSSLIIQKPKARSDFGNLLRPSDGWWEPYVARGETTVGDVVRLNKRLGVKVSSDAAKALKASKPDVVIHCTGSLIKEVMPQLEAILKTGTAIVSTRPPGGISEG